MGDLRRTTPVDTEWGMDRGSIIDRYYIEKFLAARSAVIRGHVLEVGDDLYTHRYGGGRVTKSDVLHVVDTGGKVTIVADLTAAAAIPSDTFDCAILTQTLQFIYDVRAVVRTLHRILKPGGAALLTCPGITKVSQFDSTRWGDYWRFTALSAKRLFAEVFPADGITVHAYGNVLSAAAFLYGLATEDLSPEELDVADPLYEVTIGIEAIKPS
jgi:SAM-dependent methyltransferase